MKTGSESEEQAKINKEEKVLWINDYGAEFRPYTSRSSALS
jgi:hypothetical protein